MKLYRICTEDINRGDIEEIVSDSFPGFTCIGGIGYWKGKREYSLIIEIMADDSLLTNQTILDIAASIKRLCKQETVLVQQIEVAYTLV